MKSGKSPGLDGFPIEYNKNNIDVLAPILKEVYSEVIIFGCFSDTFSEALISVILKKEGRIH